MKETGKPFATVIRAEGIVQNQYHAQRIGGEPVVEIQQNIIHPRGIATEWNDSQRIMVNRYAGLNCNDSEIKIKSLMITQRLYEIHVAYDDEEDQD